MGAHGVGGGVDIALLDFIENDLMLLQGKFLPAPRIEQAAHPVEAKSRGFGNGLDALEAKSLKQDRRKLQVKAVNACVDT